MLILAKNAEIMLPRLALNLEKTPQSITLQQTSKWMWEQADKKNDFFNLNLPVALISGQKKLVAWSINDNFLLQN